MEMIRENDPGVNGEGPFPADATNRVAQEVDSLREQGVAAPLQQVDGEKSDSTRDANTAVVGHSHTQWAATCNNQYRAD
jgi:hypothetical protein